jgi:uncharacterized membrane protein
MRSRTMRRVAARYVWDRIKVSLWFIPLVMALAALILSRLMGWLDAQIPDEVLHNSRFILSGTAIEMRTAMIGLAGTILATAGVVFSLLTLPLSTVAAQFGSRLLRVFLRDRTTQFVLGTFVGTFTYCILTALSMPPADFPRADVPQVSVTVGLILSLATFGSLIILIQHISMMLQAPNIVAAAGAELMEAIGTETPGEYTETRREYQDYLTKALEDQDAYPLKVTVPGYVQYVDPETIVNLAKDKDLTLRLLCQPGQFVGRGETVALVWPAGDVNGQLGKQLSRAIQTGNQRTPTQDIEYAINQLVEVAVRAMSPAINDPFTAMTCLDYLADGLAMYVQYDDISPNFFDSDGKLRLIFEPPTIATLLGAAFDMLRHASCDNATVLLYMLDAIGTIGQAAKSAEVRQDLLRHVQLVQNESCTGHLIEADQERIRLCCETVAMKLKSAKFHPDSPVPDHA